MTPLVYGLVALGVGLVFASLGLFLLSRWLERREPYGSFLRLKNRQKLAFFKRLLWDRRIPRFVKIIPILLVLYLASPIDLIPDFVPVLGYLDDVAIVLAALALVLRLTPKPVIQDLLQQVLGQEADRGGRPRQDSPG